MLKQRRQCERRLSWVFNNTREFLIEKSNCILCVLAPLRETILHYILPQPGQSVIRPLLSYFRPQHFYFTANLNSLPINWVYRIKLTNYSHMFMKKIILSLAAASLLLALLSFSQTPQTFDLHKLAKKKGIDVFNRDLTILKEKGYPGIRLSKDYGEGVAWITNVEFSEGVIEFDTRGEDVKQRSFVGLAFHGVNDSTFDAIYLRPFNFKTSDETARSHGVQYISLPEFTWRYLRGKSPGKYENFVEPAPDPNGWVHVRIEVAGSTVKTFINGKAEPALVVEKVTAVKTGKVGFYVADISGGDFANLVITRTD